MKPQKNLFIKVLFALGLFLFTPQQIEAQFLKKLQKKAKEKIEREAERRAQRRVDKKIDKEFDDAEDMIDGKSSKKSKKKSKNKKENNKQGSEQSNDDSNGLKKDKKKAPQVVWSRFDFIPGDTVIFEDGPSLDEDNGEFPSRWDLYKGGAEVAEVDGAPVIIFSDQGGQIIPYLKESDKDYLPEIFTIEMDLWFGDDVHDSSYHNYYIHLHDKKNQSSEGVSFINVYANGINYKNSKNRYPGTERLGWGEIVGPTLRHISIAYTKGKLKIYMDDTRLINIPHLEGNPTGITIQSEAKTAFYIKNVRISKGGVKYYDRFLSEGKIIVNGIKFDINKATLKPESMGPINKIYKLMTKNTAINFSVEGHTDSDGNDDLNLELSKKRGKVVMSKLIAMGIDSNRLKSNGFGESKPIDNNSTPEGKANNRRVEFIKF